MVACVGIHLLGLGVSEVALLGARRQKIPAQCTVTDARFQHHYRPIELCEALSTTDAKLRADGAAVALATIHEAVRL